MTGSTVTRSTAGNGPLDAVMSYWSIGLPQHGTRLQRPATDGRGLSPYFRNQRSATVITMAMTYQQKITFGEMRASGVRDVLIYCRDHK